jgi:hypothetical protein
MSPWPWDEPQELDEQPPAGLASAARSGRFARMLERGMTLLLTGGLRDQGIVPGLSKQGLCQFQEMAEWLGNGVWRDCVGCRMSDVLSGLRQSRDA